MFDINTAGPNLRAPASLTTPTKRSGKRAVRILLSLTTAATALIAHTPSGAVPEDPSWHDPAAHACVSGHPAFVSPDGTCRSRSDGIDTQLSAGVLRAGAPNLPSVTLPGGQTLQLTDTFTYNASLTPWLWRINAGDSIATELVNAIDGETDSLLLANLHLHGTIVSPYWHAVTGASDPMLVDYLGDNIFACSAKNNGTPSPCAGFLHESDLGKLHYRVAFPKAHPAGLYWFHPHIHKAAAEQVSRGLAGLLWVDNEKAQSLKPVAANPGDRIEPPAERFIALKDLQVHSVSAVSANQYTGRAQYDGASPSNVTCLPAPAQNPGGCQTTASTGATPALPADMWLFTVNGAVYPTANFSETGGEIWHIANTGANVTYNLQIRRQDTQALVNFQVLSKDGVGVAQGTPAAAFVSNIVMMPASRISIFVPRPQDQPGATIAATLESAGYQTGFTSNDGDTWPAAVLTKVNFVALAPGVAPPARVDVKGDATATIEAAFKELKLDARSRDAVAAARKLYHEAFRTSGASSGAGSPAAATAAPGHHHHGGAAGGTAMAALMTPLGDCPSGPNAAPIELAHGIDRLVVMDIFGDTNAPDPFRLGANQIADNLAVHGSPLPFAALTNAFNNEAPWQISPSGAVPGPSICSRVGQTETWVIANYHADVMPPAGAPNSSNAELHNFHVHQTKFQVLDFYDPKNPNVTAAEIRAQNKGRFHDTFPVPSGGWIKIKLKWDATQEGDFVYHCHILEHEDNGMMGHMRICPKRKAGTPSNVCD